MYKTKILAPVPLHVVPVDMANQVITAWETKPVLTNYGHWVLAGAQYIILRSITDSGHSISLNDMKIIAVALNDEAIYAHALERKASLHTVYKRLLCTLPLVRVRYSQQLVIFHDRNSVTRLQLGAL